MNRRKFFFFMQSPESTAELSCEQLFMRYLDSTLDGSTTEFFKNLEENLSTVTRLRLTDAGWLNCEELKPVESILDAFRRRGGHVA